MAPLHSRKGHAVPGDCGATRTRNLAVRRRGRAWRVRCPAQRPARAQGGGGAQRRGRHAAAGGRQRAPCRGRAQPERQQLALVRPAPPPPPRPPGLQAARAPAGQRRAVRAAGTRSARCSWSSGASRAHPRRPAATASCAPSCTWWIWPARPAAQPRARPRAQPRPGTVPVYALRAFHGSCGASYRPARQPSAASRLTPVRGRARPGRARRPLRQGMCGAPQGRHAAVHGTA